MVELDSRIEPMSQETADALVEAFEMFNKNMAVTCETVEKFNNVIKQEMARQAVDKFLCYAEKYTCASFVTRWYWKRKAFKMANAIGEVSNFLNNGF